MITVAMGTMMGTMDASITTIAFPELTRVFDCDVATVMWVAVAYILVSSSLMLVTGRDQRPHGKKKDLCRRHGDFHVGDGGLRLHPQHRPVDYCPNRSGPGCGHVHFLRRGHRRRSLSSC